MPRGARGNPHDVSKHKAMNIQCVLNRWVWFQHIEADSKWPPFRRRHFQVRINISALVQIMAWRRPGASHWQNQWWLVYYRIYTPLGLKELKQQLEDIPRNTSIYGRRISNVYNHIKFGVFFNCGWGEQARCKGLMFWKTQQYIPFQTKQTSWYVSQCWPRIISP